MYQKLVSTSTISRHLHEYGYENVLPQSTHMLTSDEKYLDVYNGPKGIKVVILLARYLHMRLHFSLFAIEFGDGQKLLVMN